MQKSYECEVATHIGPESCGAARKSSVEASNSPLPTDTAPAFYPTWMRESRLSGSVEGVMSDHDSYSDFA